MAGPNDYPVRDGSGNIIETGNNGGSIDAPAGNAQAVKAQSLKLGPFSLAATGNLFAQKVEGYTVATVQLFGTFVATVAWEVSNDSTNGIDGNWASVVAINSTSTGGSADSVTSNAPGVYYVPCGAAWVRARVSTFTSGTVQAVAEFEQGAWPSPRSVNFPNANMALNASATIGTGTLNGKVKSIAAVNLVSLKATAGKMFRYSFHNNTAAAKFVKFYNKASAPVVATDVPIFTVIVPANGVASYMNPIGKAFSTGIAYAITGGIAETDATAIAVDDVVGNIDYI